MISATLTDGLNVLARMLVAMGAISLTARWLRRGAEDGEMATARVIVRLRQHLAATGDWSERDNIIGALQCAINAGVKL